MLLFYITYFFNKELILNIIYYIRIDWNKLSSNKNLAGPTVDEKENVRT